MFSANAPSQTELKNIKKTFNNLCKNSSEAAKKEALKIFINKHHIELDLPSLIVDKLFIEVNGNDCTLSIGDTGLTCLHFAIIFGNTVIATHLIHHQPQLLRVVANGHNGNYPIHFATLHNQPDIIDAIIHKDEERLSDRNANQENILELILCQSKNTQLALMLIDKYPALNEKHLLEPIHVAAICGDIDRLTSLIHTSQNRAVCSKNGYTFLHHLIESNHAGLILHFLQTCKEFIIPILAIKNQNGITPLMLAVASGNTRLIEEIVALDIRRLFDCEKHGKNILDIAIASKLPVIPIDLLKMHSFSHWMLSTNKNPIPLFLHTASNYSEEEVINFIKIYPFLVDFILTFQPSNKEKILEFIEKFPAVIPYLFKYETNGKKITNKIKNYVLHEALDINKSASTNSSIFPTEILRLISGYMDENNVDSSKLTLFEVVCSSENANLYPYFAKYVLQNRINNSFDDEYNSSSLEETTLRLRSYLVIEAIVNPITKAIESRYHQDYITNPTIINSASVWMMISHHITCGLQQKKSLRFLDKLLIENNPSTALSAFIKQAGQDLAEIFLANQSNTWGPLIEISIQNSCSHQSDFRYAFSQFCRQVAETAVNEVNQALSPSLSELATYNHIQAIINEITAQRKEFKRQFLSKGAGATAADFLASAQFKLGEQMKDKLFTAMESSNTDEDSYSNQNMPAAKKTKISSTEKKRLRAELSSSSSSSILNSSSSSSASFFSSSPSSKKQALERDSSPSMTNNSL
jgi:ankyrin repeat protein